MVGVLSCFNFDIIHVNGVKNKVADCLSHYYEYDTKDNKHPADVNVNADVWLDPDGELFPTDCYMEIHTAVTSQSKCLTKQKEQQVTESETMNGGRQRSTPIHDLASDDDVTVIASNNDGTPPWVHIKETLNLKEVLQHAYHKDTICTKILACLEAHPRFNICEGLIWTKNQLKQDIICIPKDVLQRGRRLVEIIIDHAHRVIGHYIQFKTLDYIWRSYWWPNMATDIEVFCASCTKFQMNKASTLQPPGLLHGLPIPERPWQSIRIDFMGPLPQSHDYDYLMVVIDQLSSEVHLVPTTTWVTAKEVAWLFLKEVVWLHGVPDSIVLDCWRFVY